MPKALLKDWHSTKAALQAAALKLSFEQEEEKAASANVFAKYRPDPVAFCKEVLGQRPSGQQRRILESVRDNRRTLVVSCNSIGKDWVAAAATLWWMCIWNEAEVMTTAPTGDQVRLIQWKELRGLYNTAKQPLPGHIPEKMPEWNIGPRRMAFGRATDTMEKVSGHHSPNQLICVTEGTAVSDDIFDGISSLMASGNGRLLVITNPTKLEGRCYEAAHGKREGWNVINVSAFDTTNLVICKTKGQHPVPAGCKTPYPFLITHEFVEECKGDFGEDSDYYRVHVLGEWPKASVDQVIPLEWVENAIKRETPLLLDNDVLAGLDIARMGNDRTALAMGAGSKLMHLAEWAKQEVTETEGKMRQAYRSYPSLICCIDDTGLGGGVAPNLQEDFGQQAVSVVFGGSADDKEHYANKMTEMWMRLAYAVRDELDLSYLKDSPLGRRVIAQLTRAKKHVAPDGRLRVDKAGGGSESPDLGDALALWNEARIQGYGSGSTMEELQRMMKPPEQSDSQYIDQVDALADEQAEDTIWAKQF